MKFSNVSGNGKYLGTVKFYDTDFSTGRTINEFKQKFSEEGDELKHERNEYTFHYGKEKQNEFACKTHRVINYFID